MAAASDGENAIFPALGPTQMPLGLGQVALGCFALGRFSPRWTAGALPGTCWRDHGVQITCAFPLFITLTRALAYKSPVLSAS